MGRRYFSYSTEVDVEVSIPDDQVLKWASEISSKAAVSGSQAKFDLEGIYVALRKHGELALASRLRDIIDQGELYRQ